MMVFGVCCIADGLVRVFSLGFLHARFQLEYARRQAKRNLVRLKKLAAENTRTP